MRPLLWSIALAAGASSAAELRLEEVGVVAFFWTSDSRVFVATDGSDTAYIGARSGRIERYTERATWRLPAPAPEGVTAEVEVTPTTTTGTWKDNTWSPPKVSTLGFFTRSPRGRFRSIESRAPAARLEVLWAPDGRRVAWILRHRERADHGFEGPATVVVGAVGPRVQVLAEKQALDTAVARLGDLLDRLGLPMTQAGPILKPRKSTVVYFAPEAEAQARTIAEALPGATVEPLTWEAHADVVVALSSSTLRGLR